MQDAISYAQHYEDMHLLRCFGAQPDGFYVDIGAGHPVYDNVSYAFYLKGWRGITAEPNPWLTQLSAALRPRDQRIQSLVGAAEGEATYYLVEHFHGLSTTIESNAQAAQRAYGKSAKAMPVAVTTLAALCERHAPGTIDFLKIDVEGAEKAVLAGNDWRRFRPKIVLAEALAPLTLTPSWDEWEMILTGNGYSFAYFDGLNRYYVADEHGALAPLLAAAPRSFDGITPIGAFKPALDDRSHPDHQLATLLSGTDMVRLPLLSADTVAQLLTAGMAATELDRPATPADVSLIHARLFGPAVPRPAMPDHRRNATIRGLYRHFIDSEQFRAACGRISASYAW